MIHIDSAPVVAIGLGGIAQGWLPFVLLYRQTGILPFPLLLLVDGKNFGARNRQRQHFGREVNKANELARLWQRLYPGINFGWREEFVTEGNVHEIVTDGSIVLLSPDNHATRRVVSRQAEMLQDILLITGGNDDISENSDGSEGTVLVHCKSGGNDITPPITRYHPEIASPNDTLPTDVGCWEQAQSHPQLLATNLMVGVGMASLLLRYLTLPSPEATRVVELWVNSRTEERTSYGIDERPL